MIASICLPHNRRVNVDGILVSILDSLAIEGSVEHIDAVFIRVYRGKGKGRVEASVITPGTAPGRGTGVICA